MARFFEKSRFDVVQTGTLYWRRPIFPGRFQPSIFGVDELNYRVRDGNGWTLNVINTDYISLCVIRALTSLLVTRRGFEPLLPA